MTAAQLAPTSAAPSAKSASNPFPGGRLVEASVSPRMTWAGASSQGQRRASGETLSETLAAGMMTHSASRNALDAPLDSI